jgi:hypothetical protein
LRLDLAVQNARSARVTVATAQNWSVLAAKDEALRKSVDLLAAIQAFRQP